MPFALYRPYAKQLQDGRVLVTGRHVNGGLGTYGWCGDLKAKAGEYHVGGPRQKYEAELTSEALVIENGPEVECRYTLPPPTASSTEVLFEADVKVEGASGQPAAFMSVSKLRTLIGPIVIYIAPDWIGFSPDAIDANEAVDMTRYRTVTLQHRRGLFQVLVDDGVVMKVPVYRNSYRISDSLGGDVTKRTQFGQYGETGRSFWKRVSYSLDNSNQKDYSYSWEAANGD